MTELRPIPVIDLGDVRLAALVDDDAAEIFSLAHDDAAIRRFSSLAAATSLAETQRWVRSRDTADRMEWLVRTSQLSVAGRVALHKIDLDEGVAEIGYGLFEAHRGRGLARRMVEAVTAYGFETLGLRRITLEHAIANDRSCALATACRYRLEGTMRQAFEDHEGGYDDAHLHARLRTD